MKKEVKALVIESTLIRGKLSLRDIDGKSIRDALEKAGFEANDKVIIRIIDEKK